MLALLPCVAFAEKPNDTVAGFPTALGSDVDKSAGRHRAAELTAIQDHAQGCAITSGARSRVSDGSQGLPQVETLPFSGQDQFDRRAFPVLRYVEVGKSYGVAYYH
jgi:hypothetical protein